MGGLLKVLEVEIVIGIAEIFQDFSESIPAAFNPLSCSGGVQAIKPGDLLEAVLIEIVFLNHITTWIAQFVDGLPQGSDAFFTECETGGSSPNHPGLACCMEPTP